MGCLPYNFCFKFTKIKYTFLFKALELFFLTRMRPFSIKQNHFSISELAFLVYGMYPHSHEDGEIWSVENKVNCNFVHFLLSILHSQREPGTGARPFGLIWAKPRHLQTWYGYPRIGLDLEITLVPLKIWNSRSGPS